MITVFVDSFSSGDWVDSSWICSVLWSENNVINPHVSSVICACFSFNCLFNYLSYFVFFFQFGLKFILLNPNCWLQICFLQNLSCSPQVDWWGEGVLGPFFNQHHPLPTPWRGIHRASKSYDYRVVGYQKECCKDHWPWYLNPQLLNRTYRNWVILEPLFIFSVFKLSAQCSSSPLTFNAWNLKLWLHWIYALNRSVLLGYILIFHNVDYIRVDSNNLLTSFYVKM